jgi:N-carbamoylputrescine amidase
VEKKSVKIGIIQTKCVANKEANINIAVEKINEIAQQGAQIICLQELFASLYFCSKEDYNNFSIAEPIPGPTTQRFLNCAGSLI